MDSSTGTKDNSYDDDPYGTTINQQEQSGLNNPWKFAAGYLDSSTGLYKFGVRYYDPTLGRWTQQDPVGGSLGDLNSANRYVYAGDDPVNAVDPSGKFCIPNVVGAIALAFVVLAVIAGTIAVFLSPAAPFFAIGALEVSDMAAFAILSGIDWIGSALAGYIDTITPSVQWCFG
jgi:RHS repeat-associated protein